MSRREDLISTLSSDLQSVRRVTNIDVMGLTWLVLSAVYVIAATHWFGPIRPNAFSQLVAEPRFLVETVCGVAAITLTALTACGYRVSKGTSHHYYAVESLRHTLGLEEEVIRTLDSFRKKRNVADYERTGAVTAGEAAELLELAHSLREHLAEWLRKSHPNLLPE